jgi:hypothetical protein
MEDKKMDLEQLKKDEPGVYAQAMQDGIDAERKRVNAHMVMMPHAQEIAMNAIKEGKSFMDEELQAQYLNARTNAAIINKMENDNAEPINNADSADAEDDEATIKAKKEDEAIKAELKKKGVEV